MTGWTNLECRTTTDFEQRAGQVGRRERNLNDDSNDKDGRRGQKTKGDGVEKKNWLKEDSKV